jgi:hypothetical protein
MDLKESVRDERVKRIMKTTGAENNVSCTFAVS